MPTDPETNTPSPVPSQWGDETIWDSDDCWDPAASKSEEESK